MTCVLTVTGISFVLRALRADHEAHGSKLFHGPKKALARSGTWVQESTCLAAKFMCPGHVLMSSPALTEVTFKMQSISDSFLTKKNKSNRCWCHLSWYQCKMLDCYQVPTCAILWCFVVTRSLCREGETLWWLTSHQRNLLCTDIDLGAENRLAVTHLDQKWVRLNLWCLIL